MLNINDKIGPYVLIKQLGVGAFGAVWLGEKHTPIATTKVALKIPLSDEINFNFIKKEASLWVEASGHPNVLPLIDADIYDNIPVIVSEYAPSGSLKEWISQNVGFNPSILSALEIIDGILSGLEHLHSKNIIHRDIKPANILLQGQTPRLADFGISRFSGNISQESKSSGTPAYMAPEAFEGEQNEQTDLWSVNVILYQMLAGQLPFPQDNHFALMYSIMQKSPQPLPSSIPDNIRQFVERSFEKVPANRYPSAREMRKTLQETLSQTRLVATGDIKALSDNDIGNSIKLGGKYRNLPLCVVASNWINYYDTGWVRSGWLYVLARTHNFAESFFKIHIFHDGTGYIHLLASANPSHTIWLETSTGFRKEETFCWDDKINQRTALWRFTWK